MKEQISLTTVVKVDPVTAFEVFTSEIDLWWKRGPVPAGPPVVGLRFEPGVRLLRVTPSPVGETTVELGRVRAWEPGERLCFEWPMEHGGTRLVTEVDVRFQREGGGTRVTLEHRGWEPLVPAERGGPRQAARDGIAVRWSSVLVDFASHTRR